MCIRDRPGDEIPGAGEGSVGRGIFGQEAPSLLPQLYSGGDDEPPYTKGIAKTRHSWTNGALGGGVVGV